MTVSRTPPVVVAMLKAPRVGAVKTRLARDLGANSATAVYRRLVEHQLQALPETWRLDIHFSPADAAAEMAAWLGPRPRYVPQTGADLGARLIVAIDHAFADGAKSVVVIGGDCPALDRPTLEAAADGLASADVVLGPANDGGYYLIGLRRPQPVLFTNIAWSSPTVLTATRERIHAAGLTVVMLPMKEDVDDLASWQRQEHLVAATAAPTSQATV